LDGLPDIEFAALAAAIERVLGAGGPDLVHGDWLEPLGGGLHEFRARHIAVLVRFQADDVIWLLDGHDQHGHDQGGGVTTDGT
jgi:hypothetical protein